MASDGPTSSSSARIRFVIIVGGFAVVQACVVLLGWIATDAVDATRSYATGESLYSKGQRAAVLALHRFAEFENLADFKAFERSIVAPKGDGAAREAILRQPADLDGARAGFLVGRNAPPDISGLVELLVWFRHWQPFAAAIADWENADRLIAQLDALGHQMPGTLSSGDPAARRDLLSRIDAVDLKATGVEEAFLDHVGTAARRLKQLVDILLAAASGMLWLGGAWLAWRTYRQEIAVQKALETSSAQALRANRAKSDALTHMSHELRTPLNAVIGFSEALLHGYAGTLAPKQQEYVTDICDSGRHLHSLISDILDFSKIESGRLALDDEALDLAEVIEEVHRMMSGQAAAAQVGLRTEIPENFPALRADRRRVRQILLNLLSNAVKFTPPGGEVRILVQRRAGGIVLSVVDTGIGIAAGDIPRAFELFGQIANGVDHKAAGTGLGLPLAKRLAELHDAALELESSPGIGTTASVTFPKDRVLADGTASSISPAGPTRGRAANSC